MLRIIGGRHRGRHLVTPPGLDIRPTADRAREALFNILGSGRFSEHGDILHDARVLDAFAGTGALGLEALSRGAGHVTFMENLAVAREACERNIRAMGEEARCRVLSLNVLHPQKAASPYDLVLMDPPYGQHLASPGLQALARAGWIGPESLIVVETMAAERWQVPEGFTVLDERRYGKARLAFLQLAP